MRIFIFILFWSAIIDSNSLVGQCPTRDSLLKRLDFFKNSPSFNKKDRLNELLQYDIKTKDCSYINDSVYTFLLSGIGVTYYLLGDYIHAIQYTKKALNIIYANADNPAIDKRNLNKYYFYLTIFYDSLRQADLKNEAADSCISTEIKLNTDYRYSSFLLASRVRSLYIEGEYNLCADLSTLGETLIHRFYKYFDSLDYVAYFIYYKARALYGLRKFTDAEKFLESKKEQFSKVKNKNYIGGGINSLYGFLHKAKGDNESAIADFLEAFRYDLQTGKITIADDLRQIGIIYSKKIKQANLSLYYFFKALKYANATDSVYILGNIANVYAEMTMFDSAYFFFRASFNKIKPGIDENDLVLHIEEYSNVDIAEFMIELVLDKADTYLHQYLYQKRPVTLQAALRIYKCADKMIDNIKSQQSEFASKLFWRNYTKRLYEHAIMTSYIENDMEAVFYFFEKSRAVLLNDQVTQLSKISNDDILKKAQEERRIVELEREKNSLDVSSARYLEIQKELIIAKQARKKMEEIIQQTNPLYYQSFLDSTFISLQDVKDKLLKEHQALLEFFNGDSAVYTLLVTSGETIVNKIDKNDFDSAVRRNIYYISDPSRINEHTNEYFQTASHLYQLIFRNSRVPDGRIVISPDGQYFPFEALIMNTNTVSPVYFLNNHAVSYTYSARFLLNNFTDAYSPGNYDFLGIAPVNYASSLSLAALSGSDHSLHEIGNYFSGAENFLSGRASKNNFVNQFSKYKLIQLYTHASQSSKNDEPVIYFADSALYLSDLIPENKPATQLIVLSACETGNGKFYQGEGVFSFNRGFAALGIPSSVSNLWSVDNKSTYKLTELFYKYIAKGLPIDIALQKAKLKFIENASRQNRLPYYWAAAILVGKTNPVTLNKPVAWKYLAVILAMATLCYGGWRLFKRKKQVSFG